MSSPLSRIMNPYPFAALNHFTVPISLNALASFFPITYVDLRSEDRSQSREHLRSNLPNPLLPFTPTSTTAKSKLAHPTRTRYNCQQVHSKMPTGLFRDLSKNCRLSTLDRATSQGEPAAASRARSCVCFHGSPIIEMYEQGNESQIRAFADRLLACRGSQNSVIQLVVSKETQWRFHPE